MAKQPDKDFDVPVRPDPRNPKKSEVWHITAPDTDAARELAWRIAQRRGWKSAEIGKAQEKK